MNHGYYYQRDSGRSEALKPTKSKDLCEKGVCLAFWPSSELQSHDTRYPLLSTPHNHNQRNWKYSLFDAPHTNSKPHLYSESIDSTRYPTSHSSTNQIWLIYNSIILVSEHCFDRLSFHGDKCRFIIILLIEFV